MPLRGSLKVWYLLVFFNSTPSLYHLHVENTEYKPGKNMQCREVPSSLIHLSDQWANNPRVNH